MLKELRDALVAKQNDKALQLAERAINEMPTSVDAQHLAAVAYVRDGQIEKAGECFERALMMQPDNIELHMNLARLHLAKGDVEEAKRAFKNAAVLDPNQAGAHSEMAHLEAAQGRLDTADELYLTALRADPNSVTALVGRGHVLLERRQLQEAYQVAQKALKIAVNDARAQALAGRVFYAQRNFEFAKRALENALKLRPDFYAANILMAQTALAEGQLPVAEPHIRTAARAAPNNLMLRLVRAEFSGRTGNLAQAVEDLDFILATAPHHLPALKARTQVDLGTGKVDAAIARLKQATSRFPDSTAMNVEYIRLLLQLGEAIPALAAARLWANRNPNSAVAYSHVASIAELTNEFDVAASAAERAVELDRNDIDAAMILARTKLRLGKLNEALHALNNVRVLSMSDQARVLLLRLRGRILDALGERHEAIGQWQEANNIDQAPRLYTTIGEVLSGPMIEGDSAGLQAQITNELDLVFLVGIPASGVEAMAMYLANAANTVVLNDRFVEKRRVDLIADANHGRMNLPFSTSDLEHVRSRYLKALRRVVPPHNAKQEPVTRVFDWVPALDVRQFRVLQAALPEARWVVVQRPAKDCLLNAIAGLAPGIVAKEPSQTARVLATHAAQIDQVTKELAKQDVKVAFDANWKAPDLTKLCQRLGIAEIDFESWQRATRVQGGLPAYFTNARWQAYEKQLDVALATVDGVMQGR